MIVWSQENAVVGQSALWFPLILYSLEKYLFSQKVKYFLLLVLSLSCCILAGFLQVAFYIFITVLIYGFYRITRGSSKHKVLLSIKFMAAFLFSLTLTALQLFPSIEAFYESARSVSTIDVCLKLI